MRRFERKEQKHKEALERQATHESLTTQQKIDKLKSRYTIIFYRMGLPEEMMSMKEYCRLTAQLEKEQSHVQV